MTPTTQMKETQTDIEQLSINTIRMLAIDAVEKANSGHPGMPMGMAPVAYVLWTKFMKYNPKNPNWPNRDRFVLSAGHGSMLLYAMLHLTGYDVSLDDLKNFRQWGSKTPGHPEYGHTVGVETTTGPLGQGIATAVGMVMGQKYLNSLLKPDGPAILDHYTYGICSDGDLMEGVGGEAASLAGHLGLNGLIFFYDDNKITIDGKTDLAYSDDVKKRFESYHWFVQTVNDANDLPAIEAALKAAQAEKNRPCLIITKSLIGYGSPNKANTAEAHGAALGADEVKLTKENLGWPTSPDFYVPKEVADHFKQAAAKAAETEDFWKKRYEVWAKENPDAAKLWARLEKSELPEGWEKQLPDFSKEEKMATRSASGKVLNALASVLPELIGGSADLAPSNNTMIKGAPAFSKNQAGRNLHFGVREHAMASALNGMALGNVLIPYGGTFLIFSDYMKGGMRISALIKKRVIYILTHDSIGLGEDGPTHQPIEQLVHLRAIPNMRVIRPADATETAGAWKEAIKHKTGPTCLILTRQNLPVLQKSKYPTLGQVEKGGYILSETKGGTPKLILIATGSEVQLALGAQTKLEAEGTPTRVVSMPCCEIFDEQPESYRESVLPKSVRARLSIEALSPETWGKYVGLDGDSVAMTSFGASAPGNVAMEKFGFTIENVISRAKKILK